MHVHQKAYKHSSMPTTTCPRWRITYLCVLLLLLQGESITELWGVWDRRWTAALLRGLAFICRWVELHERRGDAWEGGRSRGEDVCEGGEHYWNSMFAVLEVIRDTMSDGRKTRGPTLTTLSIHCFLNIHRRDQQSDLTSYLSASTLPVHVVINLRLRSQGQVARATWWAQRTLAAAQITVSCSSISLLSPGGSALISNAYRCALLPRQLGTHPCDVLV